MPSCVDLTLTGITPSSLNGWYKDWEQVLIIFVGVPTHMNILILPGAESLLTKQEIDWIHQTVPGNEKVLGDAIDFAVSHPETYVGISIGGYGDNTDYVIEVTEIDREDMDYWQLRGEVGPTNYTADILRIQKTAVDVDNIEIDEEEEDAGERRLLVGRVYL